MNSNICKRCGKNHTITEVEDLCASCLRKLKMAKIEGDIQCLEQIQKGWDEQDRLAKIHRETTVQNLGGTDSFFA